MPWVVLSQLVVLQNLHHVIVCCLTYLDKGHKYFEVRNKILSIEYFSVIDLKYKTLYLLTNICHAPAMHGKEGGEVSSSCMNLPGNGQLLLQDHLVQWYKK